MLLNLRVVKEIQYVLSETYLLLENLLTNVVLLFPECKQGSIQVVRDKTEMPENKNGKNYREKVDYIDMQIVVYTKNNYCCGINCC